MSLRAEEPRAQWSALQWVVLGLVGVPVALIALLPIPAAPIVPEPTAAAEPSYANCDAVRAAGAVPIRPGDPGFEPKFDRDGDGQGCGEDRTTRSTGTGPPATAVATGRG